MSKRRVVVTGMGAVTPYGVGVKTFWDSIVAGKSGISLSEGLAEGHTVLISGQVKDFNPEDYINPKDAKRMDRYTQFAMVAADEAIADAKLEGVDVDPYKIGVIVSSAAGGFRTLEKSHKSILDRGPTKCSPFTIPMMIADMASGRISMKYGFKGINKAVLSACATGTHSIGDAFRAIQYGDADIVVAGGCEATICDIGIGAFTAAKTLSKRNDEPEKASRPYDKDRDGFIMSEGAGVLVLEELEHALKRNARIYGEIIGFGATTDAYHITSPCPNGECAAKAMSRAIKNAHISEKQIDYINAHGTSTHLNDSIETKAIKTILGNETKVMVSSTKGNTGHLLGAAGAVEAIICTKALEEQIVPPTINYKEKDEECDLDIVPNESRKTKLNIVMSNSLGFGGHNGSIILKRWNMEE